MRFKLRCPGVFIFCITAIYVLFNFFWSPKIHFLDVQKPSCACHKCLTEGDPCFKELINSAPMPFLSRQSPTSEDAFNWWKHIYRERYNFTFYNTTVDEVLKMFSSVPVVQSSPDRCRTCAVVGNSGNLKGSHYGPLIDFHDIVIRMNYAPIKGYETDVGTKTTYHVMYPESAIQLDNTTHLVFFPFKINDLLWLLETFSSGNNNPGKSQSIPNKDLVMILNPAFMKYVHESWLGYKGYYPSTGFLTMALSMYICDEISIFGFGADRDGNWNHYFEILRDKELKTGSHPGKEEYQFIQQLHKKQIIRFFKEW